MRDFLFKPRRIPGVAPLRPDSRLSGKKQIILFVVVLILGLLQNEWVIVDGGSGFEP
jgi:hypothetical protein